MADVTLDNTTSAYNNSALGLSKQALDPTMATGSVADLKAAGYSNKDLAASFNIGDIDALGLNKSPKELAKKDIASNPQISPSHDTTNDSTLSHVAKTNSWFAGSYLAVLDSLLSKIAATQSAISRQEALNEITNTKTSVSIAQTSSALTTASYEAQAEQKTMEAIASFATAGISTFQLGMMNRNIGKGQKEAEAEIAAKQKTVSDLEKSEHPTVKVGDESVKHAEPPQDSLQLHAEKKALASLQANKVATASGYTQRLDNHLSTAMETMKQSIHASSSLVQAELTRQQGQAEALIKLNDCDAQIINKQIDSSSQAKNSANQDFSQLMDLINKLTDSNFKGFSPRG